MSLRTQIRDAIDDVTPPVPDLGRRVTAYVLADDVDRKAIAPRRARRWSTFRAPLALVAAALVIALTGGLVLAGRVWRNENLPPATISQPQLKNLENRPFQYPTVAPGATCPTTPLHLDPQIGMVIGDGPIYFVNGGLYEANDWGYWVSLGLAAEGDPGLVLVRARDLKSDAQVAFAQYPLEPTPMTAVGSVLGTSRVANHEVQMRSEAAVPDPSQWSRYPKGVHTDVITLFGMQKGSSGCIGFQIDGSGFSELVVVQPAVPGF